MVRGKHILEFLEKLRRDLDERMVRAKAVPAAEVKRVPREGDRWVVLYFREPAACRAHLLRFDDRLADAPYTFFWSGPQFPDAFLSLCPYDQKGRLADSRLAEDLLNFASKQVLFHRLGVDATFRKGDCGIPVLKGYVSWLRHSFRPKNGGYPRVLGGCPPEVVVRMKERIQDGTFPTLEELFDAPHEMFDADDKRLYWAAVLLAEYLAESDPKNFFKHLASYTRRSGSANAKRAKEAFFESYRSSIGPPARIEEMFREHVQKVSEEWNRNRAARRQEPRPVEGTD